MNKILDLDSLAAGTVVDSISAAVGVTVSASGETDLAMVFDGANPTGGDRDLASDTHGGSVQNTGNVDVTFSVLMRSRGSETAFSGDEKNASDFEAGGAPVDDESALENIRNGCGILTDCQFARSGTVVKVSIRIDELDRDGVVGGLAHDAASNPIPVALSGDSHLTRPERIGIADVPEAKDIHIQLDDHAVILSGGVWTERFQPGDRALSSMADVQRVKFLNSFRNLAVRRACGPILPPAVAREATTLRIMHTEKATIGRKRCSEVTPVYKNGMKMGVNLNLYWIYSAVNVGREWSEKVQSEILRLKCAAVNSLSGVALCL